MKKLLLTIILLVFFLSGFSQDQPCLGSIHNGTFISTDPLFQGYRIERQQDSQIEYFNNDELRIYSDIEWLNETTYKIKVTKEIGVPDDIGWEEMPMIYIFSIIQCEGNIHRMETELNGEKIIVELEKILTL